MVPENNEQDSADIAWEGDSHEAICSFPKSVRQDLGMELRRLQKGEIPLKSRPMQSVGKRVYELKEQDGRSWYRVIYLAKVGNTIYVLHCFEKKSAKTSKKDLGIAEARLKQVLARLRDKHGEKEKK